MARTRESRPHDMAGWANVLVDDEDGSYEVLPAE